MKVIFLDFYGVMDGPMARPRRHDGTRLDPRCGEMINDLCDRTGAYIVISSDAAKRYDLPDPVNGYEPAEERYDVGDPRERAKEDLTEIGIPEERIIGCTHQPVSSIALYERPREIRDWLQAHPEVTGYVILDDKPLPFSRANIDWCLHHLGSSDTPEAQRLREAILPYDVGEAMATHFILVDGRTGLTQADVKQAEVVLTTPGDRLP